MKEMEWRKWHRRIGVVLALFLILQGGSGLLMSVQSVVPGRGHAPSGNEHETGGDGGISWGEGVESVHLGGGGLGALYRIALGLGLLWMASSGAVIYSKVRARAVKRPHPGIGSR